MGLNPRGRGRGRGGKGNFPNKGQRGGRMGGQGPMFRGGPPGMFGPPPMGFPPEPPFGGGPFFPGPSAFNFGPPRPGFGKFPRKNFKRRLPQKTNDAPVPEIDLTKPWVTEEIKTEDAKKQECLETWRKSKSDEDWTKYKSQKEIVKNLYEKAKEEHLASHQEEARYWESVALASAGATPYGGYYCETCEKAFDTEDDLYWHEGEHETCGRDGCEFRAHPKIIAKHVKMQHHSGLYRRIGKVYTEEEIAKWIEERKRKYPTRQVIAEKKALEEEKLKRGERIQEDTSKFNKAFQRRKEKRSNSPGAEKGRKNRRVRKKKRKQTVEKAIEEEAIANKRSVLPFSGIGLECESENACEKSNVCNDSIVISDEEWDCTENKTGPVEPLMNRSLGLLASAYNSEDEDEESQKENRLREPGNDNDDGEAPEEVKTICGKAGEERHEAEERPTESGKRKKQPTNRRSSTRGKRQRENWQKESFEERKLTLLEKLLKEEIRHERNVILQCVHYVVKNNFFGIT